MKRVAIVVPRCHEDLVGGAEAEAWQYAHLLARDYAVDLLTTTARDYIRWDNDLPEGDEMRDGVRIRRFHVARGRGDYFHDLHRRLLAHFEARSERPRVDWSESLQEEFIRAQGPVCPGLEQYLHAQGDDYAAVIFLTYLYPTTYDGTRALRHRRWGLVPTLHDEPAAYFDAIARMARRAPRILWNTESERRLARRLWGIDTGEVIAMTVSTQLVEAAREAVPYVFYCGRIDTHKGCAMLVEAFEAYKRTRPSALQLVLAGADHIGVRTSENVRYVGFVDDARKLALMAGAQALVHPSPYESLSIVALEAMAQGTPIVVNGECEVLADHVAASGSGFVFRGAAELAQALDTVLALNADARAAQAAAAREYVLSRYAHDSVRARLIHEVEALAAN